MSDRLVSEGFAAFAGRYALEARYFFRAVTALREGQRALLSVQDGRWLREELGGIAFCTERPAILRRCQQALATERSRRVARVLAHRGIVETNVWPDRNLAQASNVVQFRLRPVPAMEPPPQMDQRQADVT